MTMEEIAREEDLMEALEKVASNDGAPGPDRQRIDEVRKHLGTILPALSHGLLEGTYRPGEDPAGLDPEGGRRRGSCPRVWW
jgi:RNA-directed DNA polymerase